jgi:hypothetical protein
VLVPLFCLFLQSIKCIPAKLDEQAEVHQPEGLVEEVKADWLEVKVKKVVTDHQSNEEKISPQNVLGPLVAYDIIPAAF